ncbi:hypothetical protein B7R21_07760 [Subtercola boreus]|uniref:CAAX protease n=1 Tax=Subtercola boreus TaxID=120213 RepID=A0A3E0VVB5_9MICO|nr:hypothetical protein [Subtercola boreus]RFA13721.1 hypothetical protein B7R21_07760 [Subtercola boreus]
MAIPFDLGPVVGGERFGTYLTVCDDSAEMALRLYAWNIEVSASFWGGFHVLEIAVRNALNESLCAHFECREWWTKAVLSDEDSRTVSRAVSSVRRRYGDASTTGHVVAELSLGFWTGLVSNRYHASLWQPALAGNFARYAGRRSDVHLSLERLRRLRNRVAHHEPIFARDLLFDHRRLVEILDALSPEAARFVSAHSRAPSIISGRAATLRGERETSF